MKSKPVFIEYTKNVDPTDDHPTGFTKGAMFEVPTPSMAKSKHPDAKIIMYADGEDFTEDSPKKKNSGKKSTGSTVDKAKNPTANVVNPPESTPEDVANIDPSPDAPGSAPNRDLTNVPKE